jgi:hypothetical protein
MRGIAPARPGILGSGGIRVSFQKLSLRGGHHGERRPHPWPDGWHHECEEAHADADADAHADRVPYADTVPHADAELG